jgi:hypothetical protein
MKDYKVLIIETLVREVTVTASNEDYARQIAKRKYRDEEIILDYGDLDKVEFKNVKDED